MKWKIRERALARIFRKLQKAGGIHRREELKEFWSINAKSRRVQKIRYEQAKEKSK